ncbi:MAG TPA: replicative DNA helicase [Desulfomonilia bacterium]
MEETIAILPHNKDAEEFILGAVLLENSAMDEIIDVLPPQDFYSERNRMLYEEMLILRDKGIPIDYITLAESLDRKGKLDKAGGAAYIGQLTDRVPTTADIGYYASIVKDKAIIRSLITGANEIVKIARTNAGEVSDAVESAEKIIFDINRELRNEASGLIRTKELVNTLYDRIKLISEGKIEEGGIKTGFSDLDTKLMGGLHPSDLIIIAGRPGMGKTSLAMNIAEHVAVYENRPVALFSLEMGRDQLLLKILSSISGVYQTRLRDSRYLKSEEWVELTTASAKIYDAPMYIDDTAGISPMEIRAKLRRLAIREKDLALVVVDYLQLMKIKGRVDSREQEISEISRSMKAIAKEFKVPVIALSQLNRNVEARGDKRPMMSELRESGAIEQDADIILLIYRDEVYNPDTQDKGIAEINIAKHRNGPTGEFKLSWTPELTKFRNLDDRH